MADPQLKYRPFRAAAWGLYLLVAVVFSLAITVNVVRSTLAMTPDRPPPSSALLSPTECLDAARTLWAELDGHRKGLSELFPVRRADVSWTQFRIEWLTREHEMASRCSRDGADRKSQKRIFDHLETLMDLYTTHAVQFAGEVGPTLDDLDSALKPAPAK